MTTSSRLRLAPLVLAPALLAALAGCGGNAIAANTVEKKAEKSLTEQVGADQEPDISCPEDLPAEKGKSIRCTLTDPKSGTKYGMTATVTSKDGEKYRMNFQVDNKPKS